ncbi:MAG: hypothetical protein GX898_07770 [Corynebacterium sp.]|uniref:hypothetical protein n=1 Tax=uncultured Corynebacterium sp. TaxID=159447 RepID=UPI0017BD3B5E|nr:hypothetical protein [uncultured Corynebacterium sp.]NLZ58179.1 hypothetical protein [Corynebacterium sp.]
MAFGFFGRRRKNNRGEQPRDDSALPENGSDKGDHDPIEQRVQRDAQGVLTPADLLPDADFPHLDRSRADMLRRELAYRFSLEGAHIDIDGTFAMVMRPDGGAAHVSLKTLAMNVAGLDSLSQLPELVKNFVHGTLADATLNNLSTAELYRSLRLRLLPTPEEEGALEEGIEHQIRDNSVLRGFTSDTSIALVLDTEHAIRIQPLEELEAFDSLDALERAADRNTWQELLDAKVDVTYVNNDEGGEGSDFWAFESSSYYLGSSPLYLTDLLNRWAPEMDQSRGVIFAVPDRDLMIARPVTTGESLMNGITSMVRIAMRFGLSNPTSISPRLHLLHENQINTFTDYRLIEPTGEEEWSSDSFDSPQQGAIGIEVRPDAYLMEMLQQDGFGDSFDDFGPRDIGN